MPLHDTKLNQKEFDLVCDHLRGYISNIKKRKSSLQQSKSVLSDEEMIYTSILHPERGDIKITIARDKADIHIFIANRRDPDNPFVLMDYTDCRKNPARRTLDGSKSLLGKDEYGVFLITSQDRDLYKDNKNKEEYPSIVFGLNDTSGIGIMVRDELKVKPFEECNTEELWTIYQKKWDMDKRIPLIVKELFTFPVYYARYNQSLSEENINFSPERYQVMIGQLTRDIYPTNIMMLFRREYPEDHQKKMKEVVVTLKHIQNLLSNKIKITPESTGYTQYLQSICDFIDDMIAKDADLKAQL